MKTLEDLQTEYNKLCTQIGNSFMIMEAQQEMILQWKKQIAELQKAAQLLHEESQEKKTQDNPAA